MNGASGPNITHTVNPVSKYRKHANNARQLPLVSEFNRCFMGLSRRMKAIEERDRHGRANPWSAKRSAKKSVPSTQHAHRLLGGLLDTRDAVVPVGRSNFRQAALQVSIR